jgi:mono/diheme cytochrome c family protein
MRTVPVIAALAVAAGGALAGCGGGGGGSTSVPANAPTGEKVFADSCGSCHKLKAAGSTGTVGPDLDKGKFSEPEVELIVREGGGGMPAFKDQLSEEQIKAVSSYVAQVAGR